jgi:group I intron endonuclease
MPYIYKITNTINNKIYIGKTLQTIEKRWSEHCRDFIKSSEEKRPLYSAMNKYGIENFSVEEVEECSSEEALDREKYWIEYYGSFKNGYNATLGGDGRPYLDYDLIYRTYQSVKSVEKTSKLCNCDSHSVGKVLTFFNISHEERRKNSDSQNWKPIARLNKKTGEILEVFDSIKKAEKKYPNTNKHISAVCKGKRKSAGGYGWKYI